MFLNKFVTFHSWDYISWKFLTLNFILLHAVFRIQIRIRIHPIHVFLGLPDPDPDPLDRGMYPDPDSSIIKQI